MQSFNGKSTNDSDVLPDGQAGDTAARPNPQVLEKPTRRRFTAAYKARVLKDLDQLPAGERGAYLRREGLHSSHLTLWRKQRAAGTLAGLEPRAREAKATSAEQALAKRVAQLERENADLAERLHQTNLVIDVQEKVLSLCENVLASEGKSNA